MMTSILAIVVFVAIASVDGQWNNLGAGNFGQWNNFRGGRGGGNFGRGGGFPGFPRPQANEGQANEVTCKSQYAGNVLEVSIRPQQTFFFGGGSSYIIEVKVNSYDLDGKYTVAVTDFSSDNPLCLESDLGFIATSGQSPNNGLLSLFSGQVAQPQSAGVLGDIDVVLGDETTETFDYNNLFRDYREFRGLGVGLCNDVTDNESEANWNPFFPVRRNARQLCEFPVFCCKLGLSSSHH